MACTGRFRIELIVEKDESGLGKEFPVTCDDSGGISIALKETGPSRLSVLVSPAGPKRFRVEEIFGLVGLFRYLDVIEAEPQGDGVWCFTRVVERSRCRQVTIWLSKGVPISPRLSEILDELRAHSGAYEQLFGGILTIAIPRGIPSKPLTRIRRLLREERSESTTRTDPVGPSRHLTP
jgi:hypothetical protein